METKNTQKCSVKTRKAVRCAETTTTKSASDYTGEEKEN